MKNIGNNIKQKLISRYLTKDPELKQSKSSNINVLKSKLQETESKEFKKNILILSSLILGLGILGIYLSL